MAKPTDPPSLPRSSALTAFLHGIEPRAWVFALSQSGDPQLADSAFESALDDFIPRAHSLPLAEWPIQFWTCLLRQPVMLSELDPDLDLAQLTPGPRAALLLRLIAGLDVAHAARVLDVTPAAYEVALTHSLTHPDMDDAWMQELREQLHQLIHQMPTERREALAALREKAMSRPRAEVPKALQRTQPPRPGPPRWVWAAMALLALALIASFLWPFRSSIAPGQSEALPVEPVAPPPTQTDAVIITHPDYQQIAKPEDAAIAQRLAWLSWIAATDLHPVASGPVEAEVAPPATLEQLSATEQALLSSARSAWQSLDPATQSTLLSNARDWQSRTPEQRAQLRQRLQQWDQQAAPGRARRRTPFRAWQDLSAADRQRLRAVAGKVDALTPVERQDLRAQFAALPADTQRLWWLGPALGQELLPIASLFAFMPEAERPALLQALRALDVQARDDLALLAPRLSEAQRQVLRRDLLAATPEQRAALIRKRLGQ